MSYSIKYTDIKLVCVTAIYTDVTYKSSSITKGCPDFKRYYTDRIPAYVKTFIDSCEPENHDGFLYYKVENRKRKKYTKSTFKDNETIDIQNELYFPDGRKCTHLERDIISVCNFRMNQIKDACRNCCYRDSNYQSLGKGFRRTGKGCYGCNDFLSKYACYPDEILNLKKG